MDTNNTTAHSPIAAGLRVGILSGCRARDIDKGSGALVLSVEDFERGTVRVLLQIGGRTIAFFCRRSALAESCPTLHTGNPTHKITLTRTPYGTARSRA